MPKPGPKTTNPSSQRNPCFADQAHHRTKSDPLWDKGHKTSPKKTGQFTLTDFVLADEHSHALCPAGSRLTSTGTTVSSGDGGS